MTDQTEQTNHPLIAFYEQRLPAIVALTAELASIESPSHSKPDVDRLVDVMQARLAALGAQVERFPQTAVGDQLLAKWNADAPGKPILFLMHLDTVWPVGVLAARPVHVEGDRLIGPGTWDMKGSIALVLSVIDGLRQRGEFPQRPIWALFTTDEETGSVYSTDLIERTATQAGLCLVMEFATPDGGLKTWRKGIAQYTVNVTGRSSHAGNAPEKGVNAVVELAHQTLHITELNRLDKGTSVSVTVVRGGAASNVIPDSATAQVDVRFLTRDEHERVAAAMTALQPVLPGASLSVSAGHARPPMERDAVMIATFEQARALAAQLGIDLLEGGSGGGSDGNITAGLGLPTLDGLGPMGEGAHAVHEQVFIRSIPGRAALLDLMIRAWQFTR